MFNHKFTLLTIISMLSHSSISVLYLNFSICVGFLSFSFSVLIRMELGCLNLVIIGIMQEYNVLMTAHGLLMVFFFIMPFVISFIGNLLMPLLLLCFDLLLPSLNLASFWFLYLGLFFVISCSLVCEGPGVGWTVYPPLSSLLSHISVSLDLAIFSLHVTGLGSILSAMNFMSSIIWLFSLVMLLMYILMFSLFVTSFLLLVTLPILACCMTLLLMDSLWITSFFDSYLGGDSVLFQHLFWFFGHPEVYIIIIPVFGIVSHFISLMNNIQVYGFLGMIYAISTIAIIGFYVWAHHMYMVGLDMDTSFYFAASTLIMGIPTSIKVFSWLFSFWYSVLKFDALILSMYGFLVMFTLGGFTGLVLSNALLDVVLHDSYYVVGHFHYVLSLGAVFGCFIVVIGLFSVILGGFLNEFVSKMMFYLLLLGTNGIFFVMHLVGINGMPSRILDYPDLFWFSNFLSMFGVILVIFSTMFLAFLMYVISFNTSSMNVGLSFVDFTNVHIFNIRSLSFSQCFSADFMVSPVYWHFT